MAELWITAPEDSDGTELVKLRRWILESDGLRGLEISLHRRSADPETLSGTELVDGLMTVLTDKATVMAVSSAIAGWATARLSTRRTRLKMRHGEREIEIDTAAVRDIDELASWIRRQLEDEPGTDGTADR